MDHPSSEPTAGPSTSAMPSEEGQALTAAKKKRKRLSKGQRVKKREDTFLKKLYGPKDTHINLITPEMLSIMRGGSVTVPKRQPPPPPPPQPSTSKASKSIAPESFEFPQLGSNKNEPKGSPKVTQSSTELAKPPEDLQIKSQEEKPPKPLEFPLSNNSLRKKLVNKSKNPLVIDINELIKQKQSPLITTLALNETSKSKTHRQLEITRKVDTFTPGNILDTSGPNVFHRGKMRETPRKKKPSKLKRAILLSRASRRQEGLHQAQKDHFNAKRISKVIIDNWVVPVREKSPDPSKKEVATSSIKEDSGSETEGIIECQMFELEPRKKYEFLIKNQPKISIPANTAEEKSKEDKILKLFEDPSISTPPNPPENPPTPSQPPPIESDASILMEQVKKSMHTRKFRPYCDMFSSKELFGQVRDLLKELHRFQDRLYHSDPIKFRTKRRYVNGLKDVLSYLDLGKLEMIIIATDIESNDVEGGLDEKLSSIIRKGRESGVELVFTGSRFILGKSIKINKAPVSAIGILDKQGAEELFSKVIASAHALREDYEKDFTEKLKDLEISEKSAPFPVKSAINIGFRINPK